MQQVSMLDLRGEYVLFAEELRPVVDDVLSGAAYINGPQVTQLEEALARFCGVGHGVAVSSGTDALLCALMALDIGAGDEVIVPSFTFFATAGVVHRLGARPVFADIDARTFNLDPKSVENAVTPRTRAIIAVHLFGQCADMDAINDVARRHGLRVIEDACQAIGSTYHDRSACSLGDAACLSFYPTKNLGGFGEGGMILTDNAELAGLARRLRNHGEVQRYHHDRVGGNFRLDTLKAAILLVKLQRLEEFNELRRSNAARYDELLKGHEVVTPYVAAGSKHVYHQYSILSDRRDALANYLKERGIGSGVYYPVPLHRQACFADLGYRTGDLPVTEAICERILSLPCHPLLSAGDVAYVAEAVRAFCDSAAAERMEAVGRAG